MTTSPRPTLFILTLDYVEVGVFSSIVRAAEYVHRHRRTMHGECLCYLGTGIDAYDLDVGTGDAQLSLDEQLAKSSALGTQFQAAFDSLRSTP